MSHSLWVHVSTRGYPTQMSHLAHGHVTFSAPSSDVAFSSWQCQTHVYPTQMSQLPHARVKTTCTHPRCRIWLTPMSHLSVPNSDVAFSSWPCHSHVHLCQMIVAFSSHPSHTHVHLCQMSHLAHARVTLMCTHLRCCI